MSLTEGVNQNNITYTVLSKIQVVKSMGLHHNNWVQTQRCPCGICGEQTAQQQGFFQELWLSLPIIIPPKFQIHLSSITLSNLRPQYQETLYQGWLICNGQQGCRLPTEMKLNMWLKVFVRRYVHSLKEYK
jgi:hypothetical protein